MSGRPLKCNLMRDGYEAAAKRVYEALRQNFGPRVTTIAPCGGVRVVPRNEYRPDELEALVQSPSFVGIHNRQAPIEDIENDFLEWLRERNQQSTEASG